MHKTSSKNNKFNLLANQIVQQATPKTFYRDKKLACSIPTPIQAPKLMQAELDTSKLTELSWVNISKLSMHSLL